MTTDDPLAELLERLNSTPALTIAEANDLARKSTAIAVERMISLGQTFGIASGDLDILNQPEDAFRAELLSIDNNLPRQISVINQTLDGWFQRGMTPAPYYAWRLAVILSKTKRAADELAFLAAWCRHFGHMPGGRYQDLANRARKRGLFIM